VAERRALVDASHPQLSIVQQCELLSLSRSGYYYQPERESAENAQLMRLIDTEYTRHPFYGYRKITHWLRDEGYLVNKKRVQRLMQTMGLAAIVPKPGLSKAHPAHPIYPYLLRNVAIERVNQVWSADITYIPLQQGWMYLVAVIDWFSRYVLSWEVSNTLETDFCLVALERALTQGTPQIFNTDQGPQFTSDVFTGRLQQAKIAISMDGRGRALDNIFVERLWRTVKYEEVYPNDYSSVLFGCQRLNDYFPFYNHERYHQALDYKTPADVFFAHPSTVCRI
jgi:putative transposase